MSIDRKLFVETLWLRELRQFHPIILGEYRINEALLREARPT
jgi:hypothetical protein